MNALLNIKTTKPGWLRRALGTAASAALLAGTVGAYADAPVTMAPPVQAQVTQVTDPDNASQDTVFNWTEVPQAQQVTITRAVFDRGGYQLYDDVGETIVVPFTDQNLYVMKFARSSNGRMYFVNDGSAPVLYVPKDGYLENATVAGARWYPFPKDFHAEQPVYLGIAPSYSAFLDMGWYPEMGCWGGYYSDRAFVSGSVFLPTVGLFFEIGGHPYYGWESYHSYFRGHPAPYRVGFHHRDFYDWADRPSSSLRPFRGGGQTYYAHRDFRGGGQRPDSHGSFGGGRTFRGIGGGRGFGDDDTFRGNDRGTGGGHGFGGDRASGGGRFGGDSAVRGNDHPVGGFGGGRTFGGDRMTGGGRGFSGDHAVRGSDRGAGVGGFSRGSGGFGGGGFERGSGGFGGRGAGGGGFGRR